MLIRNSNPVLLMEEKKVFKVDGDFGSITETILKRWQSYKGLKVDGVCGPKHGASLWVLVNTHEFSIPF